MTIIPMLFGGLALFIYGMDQMGKGLELLAGNKLQSILEKLTNNKILGVLVGALVTAIVQSSSATTVMTVGFVSSKLITLNQAIYVIMGANIGTTITGLILTLDIAIIAPILAFIGMIMMLFIKKRKVKYAGTILFGFGILFMGMKFMGDAVKPLSNNEDFLRFLAISKNPIIGILTGAIFTAIIQSSSATTGILIAFASNGVITFDSTFYLILGSNIGTCITSMLATLNATKDAKRVAVAHISFNTLGTIIFTIFSFVFPLTEWFKAWTQEPTKQIAFLHTVFNIATTISLIPFTGLLASISRKLIPGVDERDKQLTLMYINPNNYRETIPTIASVKQETLRMYDYAKKNFDLAIKDFMDKNIDLGDKIQYNEEIIDYLNKEITNISIKALQDNLNRSQYRQLSYYIKISSNIERLGDYAYNISKLSTRLEIENLSLSDISKNELQDIIKELEDLFNIVRNNLENNDFDMKAIKTKAYKIKILARRNRDNSIHRIRDEICSAESGLIYDKTYTYILRLRDHLLNIVNQHEDIYSH